MITSGERHIYGRLKIERERIGEVFYKLIPRRRNGGKFYCFPRAGINHLYTNKWASLIREIRTAGDHKLLVVASAILLQLYLLKERDIVRFKTRAKSLEFQPSADPLPFLWRR